MANRNTPLVWLRAVAVLAATTFLTVDARPVTPQSASPSSSTADRFSGAWHWMFNGQSFATLTLTRGQSGFTGSLTGTHIELNDDGTLKAAEPSGDAAPSPIKKAWLDGSDLHITIMDGDDPMEWIVTLKDDTHGEIHLAAAAGAPNMKPIPLEKAH
jgi:hypothetical protein